jgi:hypothetical protein
MSVVAADQPGRHLGAADIDGQAQLHRPTVTVDPADEGSCTVSRLGFR